MTVIYQENYKITQRTLTLMPARHIDYQTIVLEIDRKLKIKQTPSHIIKSSCSDYWSTYEGRRQAVIRHMGYYQKVPIPISPIHKIYVFPTHSPHHDDNVWVSLFGIRRIYQAKHPMQTKVLFKNGTSITINASLHTITSQLKRTYHIYMQSKNIFNKHQHAYATL